MRKLSVVYVLILLLLSMVSHLTWLNPSNILTNGDVWFLYTEAMRTSNWGTWVSVLSLGDVNVSYNLFLLTLIWQLFGKLNLNYQMANQFVYFFPIIFVTPIAIYFYLKLMTSHRIASFIGSLVYLFTTFFLMMQNGGLLFAVAYALLPLQFYFLEKYLRSQKNIDGLSFVVTVSIALFYELRVVYISIFVFIFYILFYYITRYKKTFFIPLSRFILRSLPLAISLLLINAYIYLPLIFSSIKESAAVVATRGLFGANFFTIREPFVLMHPFWTGKVPSEFIPQPIPFYFWIFPLFAFAALFFAKKEKNIILFSNIALLMVFFGKSATDPLGWIYTWLYYNFPGFGFFREPSKFWLMLCLAYSVLIAYTITHCFDSLRKLRKKRTIAYALFLLPVVFLIISVFAVGKPAFTSELGPLFQPLALTKEHYAVKDFIAQQKEFFRTYYIPGRYRMAYWSENHPMLGLNEVANQFQTLDPRILSLLSVKYVIIPPDITNDVYRIWGSKKVYETQAAAAPGIRKIDDKSFGKFIVYENTVPYKPHIYSPSALTYVSGNPSDLLSLLPITSSSDTAFYFESQETTSDQFRHKIINEEKKQAYSASDQVLISSVCIRCEGNNYRNGLIYPFIRILPQSPLYRLILAREHQRLRSTAQDPNTHLRLALFYSAKRMTELQKLDDGKYPSEFALPVLKEHEKLLTTIQNQLRSDINGLNEETLFYIYDYLGIQTDISQTFLTKRYLNADEDALLRKNYSRLKELSNLVYMRMWISDSKNNRYFISVEKAGNYEIFLQSLADFENIEIDNTPVALKKSDKLGWVTGAYYNFSKGTHKITTTKPKSLIKTYPETIAVPENTERQEISILIEGIESNMTYDLSFNYRVSPNMQVHSYLERDTDFIQEGIIRRTADQYLVADGRWSAVAGNRFQSRFGEQKNVLKFIITKPQGAAGVLDIQNLKLIKTNSPLLVATQSKKVTNEVFKTPPTISHQWINPTKYLVRISNAAKPFYLALNESFHGSWTASYQEDNTKIDHHFSINSYANAWYVDKKGNYVIVVEFLPQRMFAFSLFISGISFGLSLIWLLYLKLKK